MSARNAGIDEAGRGPAIGPLVVCSLCIPSEHSVILEEIGVKDSKTLSSKKRDVIYTRISELAESHGWGVGVVICEPSRIDYNSINSDLNSRSGAFCGGNGDINKPSSIRSAES